MAERLKLKVKKYLETKYYVCRNHMRKTVRVNIPAHKTMQNVYTKNVKTINDGINKF